MRIARIIFSAILPLFLLSATEIKAQCELFDFFGNASATPYWYSCNGNNFSLNLQSPNNIGAWEIDWGDGSGIQSGASLVPPDFITHTYTSTVDTFLLTFTEIGTGCTVNGVVVMEEASNASIQVPVGGLTQACAPQTMEFINSSTNTSETTVFTWDFGDGSPIETYDYTNLGQVVSHTYLPGTVDCETVVTLTAENYCNTVQGGPSTATFNPIRIWDIDDAGITPSASVLCWPDNEFTFNNTTDRNCLFQGNIFQRYEYWNFGDYWGLGYDSIVDWTPWPPTFPQTIEYPAIGTYEVTLLDSNLCGIDAVTIQVEIVAPPTAAAAASATTICQGETITFSNNSTGGATNYQWDFDDGTPPVITGAATIDHVFNTAGTFDIELIAAVGGTGSNCADTVYVPIIVLPAPVAVIDLDNIEACDLLSINFTDASTGAINDWQWDFGNSNTHNGQFPPQQDYNLPGAYNVVLTVSSANGCSNSDTEIVTVHESPVSDFLVQNVCVGTEGNFLDLSTTQTSDPIISWSWDFGDASGAVDQNPTHEYPGAGTYTVELEVATVFCTSTSTQNVVVEPAPSASFTHAVVSGCSPLEVAFTNTTSGADSYSWIFGGGGGSGDESPANVFNNFGDADSVYQVTMVAQNAFGCRDTAISSITVHPNAIAQFQSFYTPGCDPDSAIFLNTSINADNFEWNFGDGTISTDENPTHDFQNTGQIIEQFDIELVAFTANGCNDTTSSTISVFPQPDFNFVLPVDTGCSPFTVQFPAVAGAINNQWTFGDGTISTAPNPSHSYGNNTLAPITYEVELVATSPFGCNDTSYAEVIVNPNPVSQFSVDQTSGCSPLTVRFTNESILADSVVWSYGDGTTSDTSSFIHSHTFNNTTNQTISYTVELMAYTAEGCSETFTRNIEVHPLVEAAFSHPVEECSPQSFVFENESVNASFYQWDLGNGVVSVAENPLGGYQLNGFEPDTFGIQLVATSMFGCEDTARSELILHPKPTASIIPSGVAGCSPYTVNFQNNSSIATSYQWNYGDGDTSDTLNLVHEHEFVSTSTAPQDFEVSLIASTDFGCADTSLIGITVYPEVIAQFAPETEGCSPLSVDFVNTSFGGATYNWSFGDGNEAFIPNPSNTFVNVLDTVRDFTVTMVAQSGFGCTDTTIGNIKVFPLPEVSIALNNVEGCFPADFEFANYTEGAETYFWQYGDGNESDSSDSLHTHTYVNSTTELETKTVTLIATTEYGCQDQESIEVEVIPEIEADVVFPEGGCSPYTAEFENNTIGAFSYLWQFGDGNFSQEEEPTYTYENFNSEDSTYTVLFIAQSLYGCADTLEYILPVLGLPEAQFIATPAVQQFPNATIDLVNLSFANDGANYVWAWGNGVIDSATDPNEIMGYTYGTWGEYTIVLSVGNDVCNDTAFQQITIEPPLPIASFEGEGTGCEPLVVEFTNTSTYGVEFLWDFGDGVISDEQNPTHFYTDPGTYNVSLTVTGPGGDIDTEIKPSLITVHPRAEAFFTVNPPVITVPDQVFFLNLSIDADSYFWDFGDGNTSIEFSPYNFYETTGWHPVTLVADTEFGCKDTFSLDQAVRGDVETRIAFPNAFTPNNAGPNGGLWTVDDLFNNDIFFPQYKGVEDFEMQIFNKWGELLFESKEVRRGWDGYYKGEMCQQDVYVWRVKVTFADGGELIDSGDVTLLR
ncbi:MAG: PKD domain-containing protein [Flavobacteriales bacterium]|nr:PKD domain-containing protein [Flavobacteriales bacterium]